MHASTSKAYSSREQFQNGCVSTPADFIPVLLPLSSCLQKAERIPRNHVGASRGSPTCFACPSLSLSLSASPLLLFLSRRFISREIHTSGRLKDGGGERERELVVTRGSHRLHRCWITGALGASIKLHSRGNVGTRAEQIRRQRMNVAGASISRLFRPRVLCPSEMNCACATYTRLRGAVRKLHQL